MCRLLLFPVYSLNVSSFVIKNIVNLRPIIKPIKMPATNKLRQKIKKLETERTTLKNEIKKLRLEADGKALMLEQKVEGLA